MGKQIERIEESDGVLKFTTLFNHNARKKIKSIKKILPPVLRVSDRQSQPNFNLLI
jgi:hypothetical protein